MLLLLLMSRQWFAVSSLVCCRSWVANSCLEMSCCQHSAYSSPRPVQHEDQQRMGAAVEADANAVALIHTFRTRALDPQLAIPNLHHIALRIDLRDNSDCDPLSSTSLDADARFLLREWKWCRNASQAAPACQLQSWFLPVVSPRVHVAPWGPRPIHCRMPT